MSKLLYIKHKDINFQLWDDCIQRSSNGVICVCSWYLNIVSPGWDAIVRTEENLYKIVFPITQYKKFGFRYIRQPDFVNELGVFGDMDSISTADFYEILQILESKFRFISSYIFNRSNSEFFKDRIDNFRLKQVIHFGLKMDKDPEELVSSFDRYTRKNIRQALKQNLQIEEVNKIQELIIMFKNNTANRIYGGVSKRQYKMLNKIFLSCKRRGNGLVYMVRNNQRSIGGVLLLQYKDTIHYLFSSIDKEGRAKNANSLLIDFVIKINHKKYLYLDFGAAGSEGVKNYKKSFATEETTCYHISYNNLPPILKVLKAARQMIILKALEAVRIFIKFTKHFNGIN